MADHAAHARDAIVVATEGTVSISLLQAKVDLRSPRQHWHVIESTRNARSLRRARVVGRTGVGTARDGYTTLTRRTSELLLEGWHLDLDETSDRRVVLTKAHLSVTITIDECWEVACIGALRASTLSAIVTP